MELVSNISAEIKRLQRQRALLTEEIALQQKLLASLRRSVAVARTDRLAEFDQKVAALSEWYQDSRAAVIRRLRTRVENGEGIEELVAVVKASPIERIRK
jgi:hypothetical protein